MDAPYRAALRQPLDCGGRRGYALRDFDIQHFSPGPATGRLQQRVPGSSVQTRQKLNSEGFACMSV